jgi:hypothetical protein
MILYSKKVEVDVSRYFKRSATRDFRIQGDFILQGEQDSIMNESSATRELIPKKPRISQ